MAEFYNKVRMAGSSAVVTIPAPILRALGIKTGDTIKIIIENPGNENN